MFLREFKMKKFLQDAVFHKTVMEKTAEYELPKSLTEWNEEILKNFFENVSAVPHDAGVDVVINNIDENRGYAKGSVVVFYKNKKINFPIIVKDFKLMPFDIFVADKTFFSASERNIKSHLMSDEVGEIKNMYDYMYAQEVKSPGNVSPKNSVAINETIHDMTLQDQMSFRKMSSLKKASIADLEKVAAQLEASPDVMRSFVQTAGDLKAQVVDTLEEKRQIPKEKIEGILDLNNVVKAKQVTVALDSELFDVNDLVPVQAPSVCELRLYSYPSMSDFMESGQSAVSRLNASKVGKPINGVVLAHRQLGDNCFAECSSATPCGVNDLKKEFRERIDQIFISTDGAFYKTKSDYDKTGNLFYSSKMYPAAGLMSKVIENISDKNTNDFHSFSVENHRTGADKVFNPNVLQNEGVVGGGYDRKKYDAKSFGSNGIFILYGAGDMWECAEVYEINKTATVEGRKIYMSQSVAIIPSNVASIQRVSSVDILKEPVYKMALGSIKTIYLIPESSVIISKNSMSSLDSDMFMEPSKPIKEIWDKQAIEKVSVYLGTAGFHIDNEAIEKLAGKNEFETKEAMSALRLLGIGKDQAREMLKTALYKNVTAYGINSDFINKEAFIDKTANKKNILKQIADALKTDTVKIASLIEDPEAVDNVLSLNFINEENITEYIDELPTLKKSVTKLANMLVASRMGLTEIDESATKKAIDALEKVIDGLESVKMAIGK